MKKIMTSLLLVLIAGCSSNIPIDAQEIEKQTLIRQDTFKNETWIETPMFLSRQGFTDTFPVNIMFRSLYKDEKQIFTQLYITKMDTSWGFYHSANGEDGLKFEFNGIDQKIDTSAGMVTTNEHFALTIPNEYLQKMSEKDWAIKVYGKRNEGVFIVPKQLTTAFIQKLSCHESKSC